MIQSRIRPVIVRLKKMRLSYRLQDMRLGEFYTVIGYDMKRLLVTNPEANKSYYIRWYDAELYRSEYVGQPPSSNGAEKALRRAAKKLADAASSLSAVK